jgi:glycosyltransferase involved in cell wall biosynthesis
MLGLDAEDKVVVIVARLYPEKNHRLLLDAFARAVAEVPRAKLLVVGEGIEQESIERRIEELGIGQQVKLLGVRRDIPTILATADVFVLCSDREGLPIAVLEAMASSLPVIATKVGDLPLVVRDKQTGILVEPSNVRELARSLMKLLSNREYSTSLGAAGRALVQREYSLEQMVRQHELLYGGGE